MMSLPDWLTAHPQNERPASIVPKTPEGRALMFVQFEMVLPRILEQVCAGETVDNAIKSLRPLVKLDVGAFLRWLKRRPEYAMYKEALEIRAEVWTGKMVQHATGKDEDGENSANDVARDKLAVETYWKLIQAQNRKDYGDVKQLEITGGISITAALQQGRSRVAAIDTTAEVIDVDLMSAKQVRELPSSFEDDDE